MSIADRVKKIVVKHLHVEADRVIENAAFIQDLEANSLDTVALVIALEQEFSCEIPDDAVQHMQTVGDVVRFIEECQVGRNS